MIEILCRVGDIRGSKRDDGTERFDTAVNTRSELEGNLGRSQDKEGYQVFVI